MTLIRDIIAHLEVLAPLAYQESYDNAGLLVGDADTAVSNVLLTLDCTEAVVDEAIARNANLIVAHHPILFKGLKQLTGRNYVERTVLKAIRHNIAIYATHTNLDNVTGGVNFGIASRLGLQDVRILSPKTQTLSKLVTFVPTADAQRVLDALHEAGAGHIGNYSRTSFRSDGIGAYQAGTNANPVKGEVGAYHQEPEQRVEVIFPRHRQHTIVQALLNTRFYDEIAYDLYPLDNADTSIGSGIVGELPDALSAADWLAHVAQKLSLRIIRHTAAPEQPIRRVAVCGGSGSFLLREAIRAGADAFVTADFKYHEFFDAEGRLMICDVGHYESEVGTKEWLGAYLAKKFTTFAVIFSETDTNPVRYFVAS